MISECTAQTTTVYNLTLLANDVTVGEAESFTETTYTCVLVSATVSGTVMDTAVEV